MELLAKEELTSAEIAPMLGIPADYCSVYLNTLMKKNKIKRTNNAMPFKYKLMTPTIELLKFYNDFFKDNIDYLLKNSKIKEFILNHEEFDEIEEMIEKCQV